MKIMRKILLTTSALAVTGSMTLAGDIDRSGQSVAVIFEEGNVFEIAIGSGNPDVTGSVAYGAGRTYSGDMAKQYLQYGGAIKYDINDTTSFALIYDRPFGANTGYFHSDPTYPLSNTYATLNSGALTGIVKYKTATNISVYGGLRVQTLKADADAIINVPNGVGGTVVAIDYKGRAKGDTAVGYVLGAAYEKPEIALRVALTYNSKIKHSNHTNETVNGAPFSSVTNVNTPQSVNLEFQSGVAPKTLVFGSVRWVDWSEFSIDPIAYNNTFGSPLTSYDDDTISYKLGVGRAFTERFSGALSFNYEKEVGGYSGNNGPTDGYKGITLGGSYKLDDTTKLSGGISYLKLGDAKTRTPIGDSSFTDNDAIGFGIKLTTSF